MRNFTAAHRLTGVGNALKRHYQVYLLEYERVRGLLNTRFFFFLCTWGALPGVSCSSTSGWVALLPCCYCKCGWAVSSAVAECMWVLCRWDAA